MGLDLAVATKTKKQNILDAAANSASASVCGAAVVLEDGGPSAGADLVQVGLCWVEYRTGKSHCCPCCDQFTAEMAKALVSHLSLVIGKSDVLFVCPDCKEYSSAQPGTVTRHHNCCLAQGASVLARMKEQLAMAGVVCATSSLQAK